MQVPTEPTTESVVAVPDVIGLPPATAVRVLTEADLVARAVEVPGGHGLMRVAAQRPVPGTQAAPGSTVVVYPA